MLIKGARGKKGKNLKNVTKGLQDGCEARMDSLLLWLVWKEMKTWTEMTLGNEDPLETKSVWFFVAQSFHWSEAGRQGVHVLTRTARRVMIAKPCKQTGRVHIEGQADRACAHRRTSTRE